jgi:hypothetical protein
VPFALEGPCLEPVDPFAAALAAPASDRTPAAERAPHAHPLPRRLAVERTLLGRVQALVSLSFHAVLNPQDAVAQVGTRTVSAALARKTEGALAPMTQSAVTSFAWVCVAPADTCHLVRSAFGAAKGLPLVLHSSRDSRTFRDGNSVWILFRGARLSQSKKRAAFGDVRTASCDSSKHGQLDSCLTRQVVRPDAGTGKGPGRLRADRREDAHTFEAGCLDAEE